MPYMDCMGYEMHLQSESMFQPAMLVHRSVLQYCECGNLRSDLKNEKIVGSAP